jgi:hypothetical protein
MALSKTTELYPTGNVVYASFGTNGSNVTITARTNVSSVLVQNPSSGATLFYNVTTGNGTVVTAPALGTSSNCVALLAGSSIVYNVNGVANTATTTVYFNGATLSGFANVYITPMA